MKQKPMGAPERSISWTEVIQGVEFLAEQVRTRADISVSVVYGIERGGVIPGALLARSLGIPFRMVAPESEAGGFPIGGDCIIIIDDIIDSGGVMLGIRQRALSTVPHGQQLLILSLYYKRGAVVEPIWTWKTLDEDIWLKFPWEIDEGYIMNHELKLTLCEPAEPAILYVKKMFADARLPTKAHPEDACFDLYAYESVVIESGKSKEVPVGVRVMVEKGWEALIRSRSGLAFSSSIQVHPGTVDAYYTGRLGVLVFNHGSYALHILKGDRFAQLAIRRAPDVQLVEVEQFELPEDARGECGMGSTSISIGREGSDEEEKG